jgi:ELWxxDGT repeat protein
VLVKNLDATTQNWPGLASAWLGGELYFVQHGALWKSDGSEAGTTKVTNLGPSGGIGFAELGVAGNGIAIALQNSHEVDQLWLSDGTAEGTSKVLPLSTFSKAPVPTIVGKAKVGTKLAGRIGVWSPADPTFTYQWMANGVAIGSATSKYFTLTSAQSGKQITFTVTATKSGYVTRSRTSVATAKVTG